MGNIYSEVFPNAKSLLKQLSESVVIAVDIPIGLSEVVSGVLGFSDALLVSANVGMVSVRNDIRQNSFVKFISF